jgi:hypothetical protein
MAGRSGGGKKMKTTERIDGYTIPQFDESDLDEPTSWHKEWMFHGAMISRCSPLFDDIPYMDNYAFEKKLRMAGVLRGNNRTDTESCEFWAYFSTKKAGMAFVERLNGYLRKRAMLLHAARHF